MKLAHSRLLPGMLGVSCGMERLSLSGRTFAGDEIFGDDFRVVESTEIVISEKRRLD